MKTTTDTPQWRVTTCSAKECGAAIIWARSETTNSRTLVNAEPSDAGRWRLVDQGLDSPVAVYVPPEERSDYAGRLHTTHWATCPGAPQFRRRKP